MKLLYIVPCFAMLFGAAQAQTPQAAVRIKTATLQYTGTAGTTPAAAAVKIRTGKLEYTGVAGLR